MNLRKLCVLTGIKTDLTLVIYIAIIDFGSDTCKIKI